MGLPAPTAAGARRRDCRTTMALPASMPSLYERVGGHRKLTVLVRNFYSSLQIHPVLGPIFSHHVESWPRHYTVLTDFWSLQTGGPSNYRGKLVAAHESLHLRPAHFALWLDQWRRSCHLHFAEPEATEMISLAEELGQRMQGSLGCNEAAGASIEGAG